jgi:phage tail-like protein
MGAVEQTSAERWALGVSTIRDAQDPWRAPAHLLPWLAQSRGVDLWFEDWPEENKRRAIAEAPRLQRLKGTLAGVRGYLALVGARITYERLPSDRHFAGGMTDAQRAEWLGRLPQLRIYPWRGTLQEGLAFAGIAISDDAFAGGDAIHEHERMYIWRDGAETPLHVQVAERAPWSRGGWVERFSYVEPISDAWAAFAELAFADQDHAGRDLARDSLTNVRVQRAGRMEPIDARARTVDAPFELVAQPYAAAEYAAFADIAFLPADERFAAQDRAADHVFRRTYLADPSIAVPDFAEGASLDGHVANMQPVTAVLGVDVSERDASGALFNDGRVVEGFLVSDPASARLARAVEAVRRAQGGTDILVVDSTTFTPVTAGDAPLVGDGITAGQMIERYH